MNRYIRMRRYNNGNWDTLFPQTVAPNILRNEGGGVLENYLLQYDNHLVDNLRHFNHAITMNTHHSVTVYNFETNTENTVEIDGHRVIKIPNYPENVIPIPGYDKIVCDLEVRYGQNQTILSLGSDYIIYEEFNNTIKLNSDRVINLNDTYSFKITPHDMDSHRYIDVQMPDQMLVDGYPMMLTLHCKLDAEPFVSFNGGEYFPIISASGNKIPGGQIEDSIIFLVWREKIRYANGVYRPAWILISTSDTNDITKIAVPTVSTYNYQVTSETVGETTIHIPGYDKYSCDLKVNYGQTILRPKHDYTTVTGLVDAIRLTRIVLEEGDVLNFTITRYDMVTKSSSVVYEMKVDDITIVATEDNQRVFDLPPIIADCNSVDFNYGQTILRAGLDYELSLDRSKLTLNFEIPETGEELVAHVITLEEHSGEVSPRSWNVPGAYTYEIKTLHESFTAEDDDVNVVPVPNFEYGRDELVVVDKEHKVLVYNVDYEIDRLNQIILNDLCKLNTGDTLYFTIFQGAIQDTPPFMVIDEVGTSGKHLCLDVSYSILRNGFVAVIRMRHTLVAGAKIKCLNGPLEPILDPFGRPITGDYVIGSYLWCVYNEDQHVWYSMSHGNTEITDTYGAFEFIEGDANFVGGRIYEDMSPDHIGEVVIPHGLHSIPTDIEVHPTEHPGFITNPYQQPSAPVEPGTTDDNVRWMQWAFWQLKYVNDGITLDSFVTGIFDERTLDVVHAWEKANGLSSSDIMTIPYIELLGTQGNRIQCTIGDIWASADEINIYVGNSGNSTSKFHYVAQTSAGQVDFKESLNAAIDMLVDMIEDLSINIRTRIDNLVSPADGSYQFVMEDFNPHKESILMVNYGQTVLREGIDYVVVPEEQRLDLVNIRLPKDRVLHLVIATSNTGFSARNYNFTAHAGDTVIDIPNYNEITEMIFKVNYSQTLLRQDIDYNLTPTGIEIKDIVLNEGDIIQITLIKQE